MSITVTKIDSLGGHKNSRPFCQVILEKQSFFRVTRRRPKIAKRLKFAAKLRLSREISEIAVQCVLVIIVITTS
jgi:hypothetical protein